MPVGTLLTLLTAGAVGAIPILLAPSAGWRWVAVFASPTVGFITVVIAMEIVHRVRRVLIEKELIPEPPPEAPLPTREEELALMRAMRDPREPDASTLSRTSSPSSIAGALLHR